jgi:hypothetical protein
LGNSSDLNLNTIYLADFVLEIRDIVDKAVRAMDKDLWHFQTAERTWTRKLIKTHGKSGIL